MRQLATKRIVKELRSIPNADRIEIAIVDGWQCVVKKGEFSVGSEAVYLEIDSLVKTADPRFAFLAKGKVVPLARIKTVRLKGALSQGLLIPASALTPSELERVAAGEELTTVLDIQKYEPPLPIGGKQAGTFPTQLVPKTDQERIQNMPSALDIRPSFLDYEVTEKLDGTSCTIWMDVHQDDVALGGADGQGYDISKPEDIERWKQDAVRVASRNWEMQRDDGNVYSNALRANDLTNKLWELGRSIAIQGEIVGPAIQGNKYGLAKQEFYVFDIYDIQAKRYLMFYERWELVEQLGLKHVPVLREELHKALNWNPNPDEVCFSDRGDPLTLDNVLAIANGQSALNPNVMREGLVFKATDGSMSFKAINNEWLIKYE